MAIPPQKTLVDSEEMFELDIFTACQSKQDFSKAGGKLERHIYDYVLTDSNTEHTFVKELDSSKSDVVVYAKLPKGFLIPTPVGDYSPDLTIAFKEGAVKHVYFAATPQTKDSMSGMDLREIEKSRSNAPASSSRTSTSDSSLKMSHTTWLIVLGS